LKLNERKVGKIIPKVISTIILQKMKEKKKQKEKDPNPSIINVCRCHPKHKKVK
jgi:hypothetical protein